MQLRNLGSMSLRNLGRLVSCGCCRCLRCSFHVCVMRRHEQCLHARQRQGMYDDPPATVELFCRRYVEPMAEESDNVHIVALTDALQVWGQWVGPPLCQAGCEV
jgi:hypothetical protein